MLKIDKSIRARWYGGQNKAIKAIVFHYTANTGTKATAKGNAQWFATSDRKASAHYCVDTGEVAYECVPPDRAAWAVGDGTRGRYKDTIGNYNSISIEMVSCTDASGAYYIPEATQDHAIELYWQLKKQFPDAIPLRHHDITGKLCPWPMVDEAAWAKFLKKLEDYNMTGKDIYNKLNEYLAGEPAPDWAEAELREAVEMGITDGKNPMTLIPRYQAAIMAKRAAKEARK